MVRLVILVIGCLAILTGAVWSQEVIVTGFPVGVGSDVGEEFFKSYYPALKTIADAMEKNRLARAIVIGGADGMRYRHGNNFKNPSLALGRAHALRNLLILEFQVDSTRIFVQSQDSKTPGDLYRFAKVRVSSELSDELSKLEARVTDVENRPPIEKQFTEIREIPLEIADKLGLGVGIGMVASPYGGMPVFSGMVTWDRKIYFEGFLAHTFWNDDYFYGGVDLTTRRRMGGWQVIYFPFENLPVGLVGGWTRAEELSQDYYKYVRMSEGPLLGVRVVPLDYLSITAVYNPARQRAAGMVLSESKNDLFLISATAHIIWGGGK